MHEIAARTEATDVDPFVLSDSAQQRLRRKRADSTLLAYRSDLRRFLAWAAQHNHIAAHIAPQPTGGIDDERNSTAFVALLHRYGPLHLVVAEYVDQLCNAGKAPSTIERALSAIAVAHRAAGAGRLATEAARDIIGTYRRDRAASGATIRRAAPLLVSNLRAMIAALPVPYGPIEVRDRALLVVGFALGARRSELCNINVEDLTFTDDGLQVIVRKGKNDLYRTVALPFGNHPETCPVRTMRVWLAVLARHGHTTGAVFRRVDSHDVIGRAANGRGAPDGRISGQTVGIIIRRSANRAGLDYADAYSGHSLRRGFATEAYRGGANPLRIARHGGWIDGSTQLGTYIEDYDRWKDNPLSGVGL